MEHHQIGDIVYNRYQIIKFIGKGGFGETYLAEDMHPPVRTCVIKYLNYKSDEPSAIRIIEEKFRQEAKILGRLGSSRQQIPEFYNFFTEEQKLYLVQEYIDGEDLNKRLRNNIFTEKQVIEILYDVLKILDYLSQNNVIHRDVKPENLIQRKSDNKIFLIDFGIIKEITALSIDSEGQTIKTVAIGTPKYMPPEQDAGKPKFASDIYALGITGFYLLRREFPSKNNLDEIIWDGIQINPYLAKILEKMVRSDYQKRYEKASDVLVDLEPLTMLEQELNQRYLIKSYLGGETFNRTYFADNKEHPHNPNCVIKQLQVRVNNQQVLQEARKLFTAANITLGSLIHSQIPKLLYHFENNQKFYLVYEFIEGQSLSKDITAGHCWSEADVITFLKDVLKILVSIHDQNIIHGDIKPSNLIRRQADKKLFLTGFSSFKQITTLELNLQGVVHKPAGTYGYMPPEQLQNRLEYRSDIYALGMTAIQALTGISPENLRTDSQGEILWQNHAQVSPKLVKILKKMTRFKAAERYQSAKKVLNALNPKPSIPIPLSLKILIGFGVLSTAFVAHRIYMYQKAEDLIPQAHTLVENKDYRGAIDKYQEVLDIFDNFEEALVGKGYAYSKLGQYAEAKESCTKATNIFITYFWSRESSTGWLCKGNAEKALANSEDYKRKPDERIKLINDSIASFQKTRNITCLHKDDRDQQITCSNAFNSQGEALENLPESERNKFDELERDPLILYKSAINRNPENQTAKNNRDRLQQGKSFK
jgi:eukaryotic-like serine/threonine-protein kinase